MHSDGRVFMHIQYKIGDCAQLDVSKQESRLLNMFKTERIYIRACISLSLTPECTLSSGLYSECGSAYCQCWQTSHTGRAGGTHSHAILSQDSGQTQLKPLTKGRPCLVGRPGSWCVCQCLWNMPLCSPVNLRLVSLHWYPVTVESNSHVVSWFPLLPKKWTFSLMLRLWNCRL